MRRGASIALVLAGLVLLPPSAEAAVTLQPIGTFQGPVFVTSDPGDEERLLVVELGGRIHLHQGGVTSTFLDLASAGLVSTGGERGLFSVALPADFVTTGRLYVFYTRGDGDLQIDEFTASGDTVSLSTRRPLLTIEHSLRGNHNGGQLQFGSDGYLYIATGDGGGGGDPDGNGQNLTTLLGKLLRIDPRPSGGLPYTLPADNPFAGATAGADEIWSYGLRNPFRFSFDRATGDLVIGDVGQGDWEEIDFAPQPGRGRGVNYGWNACEASFVYPPQSPPQPCALAGATNPVFEYGHSGSPSGCSITGGYVSRDPGVADLLGRYVYTDLCAGQIRSIQLAFPRAADDRAEGLSVASPGSFGEDACGRLYVTSLASGQVFRLADPAAPTDCPDPPPPPGLGQPPPPGPGATGECRGDPATLSGPGALAGGKASDVIVGDQGANRIRGRGGDDSICARAGKDVLRAGPGDDVLKGGPGDDRCRGGGGQDKLRSC